MIAMNQIYKPWPYYKNNEYNVKKPV